MKKQPFVSLHSKLVLLITLLFVFEGILLAIFLNASATMLVYQSEASAVYAQARQLYQVRLTLQQFENSLNRYELDSDPVWLDPYYGSYSSLQGYLANAIRQAEHNGTDDAPDLRQLDADIQALRGQFDQVIAAVDEEDWDTVYDLDAEAYDTLIPDIYDALDEQITARDQALYDLRTRVQSFSSLGSLALNLALPAFLLLAAIAALLIVRQIHAPLSQMTENLPAIEEGNFQAAALGSLPERRDEIGFLARQYLHMAAAVQQRQANLQQEAQEIRARMR